MLLLERVWRDLRHAGRTLAKSPGFTAIAVLSIAFGTGANVAVFSAADALILRPLPVARPNELVTVGSRPRGSTSALGPLSIPEYADIRDRTQTFAGVVAMTSRPAGVRLAPAAAPRLKVTTGLSDNFFAVLGVTPEVGRDFMPEENRVPGRDAVAILSYGLWQQEFGGDGTVLGRSISIAGIDFTVIGVTAQTFTGLDARFVREAVYVPLAMWRRLFPADAADPFTRREARMLSVKGRLRAGVSLSEARAELAVIGADLERAYPDTNKDRSFTAQTEMQAKFERYPLDSSLLVVLTLLAVSVLAVACANVAALLASRAPTRARDIALRLAIGAPRGQLIRQLVIESLGISLAGGAAGLAVGYAGIRLLRRIGFPTDVFAVPVMQLDVRALVFSLSVAVTSAFLFGVAPAIHTTRVDLVNTLKGAEGSATRLRLTGRKALVALQVALSLALLSIAVFVYRSFQQELTEGPGFRTTHVGKLSVDTSQARYTPQQAADFFARALDELRRLPGARSAGATSSMPLFGLEGASLVPDGFVLAPGQAAPRALSSVVDEQYFATLDIAVIEGRSFEVTDTAERPRVAIVNETMARHYWPDATAIGKRFRLDDERGEWVEIVGVVNTSKYGYSGEPPRDFVYFPFRQRPRTNMVLLVQTAGESATLLPALRETVRKLDAAVPSYDGQTIEAYYAARTTTIADVLLSLVGGMSVMGLTLTTVGLYGLVSFAVSRRTRELGIRIAVGASYGRVQRMIIRQGLAPAWVGLAVGFVLSVVTTRILPTVIPFKHAYDARIFFLIVPLILAVVFIAAFIPARRAARVDPTVALRCE